MSNLQSHNTVPEAVSNAASDMASGAASDSRKRMVPPRIYALMARSLPSPEDWRSLVDRVGSLGFSRILIDESACSSALPDYLNVSHLGGLATDVVMQAEPGHGLADLPTGTEEDDLPPRPTAWFA